MRRLAILVVLLLTSSSTSRQAGAQWMPRLQLDNDVYNYWLRHTHRPDEEYTNGVRASLSSNSAPWWGRTFARGVPDCVGAPGPEACRSTVITLGQDVYTPNLDRTPHAVEDWELERPYFAWLYVSGVARMSSARVRRETRVSLGVTGPPAGGALAQRIAHRIGFNEEATGWETQIGFEPGFVVEYRHAVLAGRVGETRGLAAEVMPEGALALGNILTRGEVGGTARLGWNLSHPWHPAPSRGRARVEFWASAGGRASFVARDMSLDGTWRDPVRRVERVPGVRQYEVAGGVRVRDMTVGYRVVTRTREYRTGPGHHTYSSMVFSLGR